jgi:hypothetical protein
MLNWFVTQVSKTIDENDAVVACFVIILLLALFVGVAALGFWLFTWAVATLFHFTIDFTFINWVAFVVLSWSFKGSSSSSK